ncbi:MAG: hypothetical protein AAB887_01580 [Patescibacteria group bacterium]
MAEVASAAVKETEGLQWSLEVIPNRGGVQLRGLDPSKPDGDAKILVVPMGSVINFKDTGHSGIVRQVFEVGGGLSKTEFRLYDVGPGGKEDGTYTLIGSVEPAIVV